MTAGTVGPPSFVHLGKTVHRQIALYALPDIFGRLIFDIDSLLHEVTNLSSGTHTVILEEQRKTFLKPKQRWTLGEIMESYEMRVIATEVAFISKRRGRMAFA